MADDPFASPKLSRDTLIKRLQSLGWLDYATPEEAVASVTMPELKTALRIYQKHFGVEASGVLTPETVRSIAEVRFCALPDVMPIQTTLARWPQPDVTVAVLSSFPRLADADARAAFDWACQQWNAVCGLNLQLTTNARTAHVLIEVGAIDGPANVLAYSQLADGTMQPKGQKYDSAEAWTFAADPARFYIDLGRVACHELGHMIGIPHIAAGNLLQPTYDTSIRGPMAGDVQEAVARYGPPRPKAPEPPSAKCSVTVEIDGRVLNIVKSGCA